MEIHSEKHGFEPLVPPARTKPVEADEVLFMFKLSKPPGGREWHLPAVPYHCCTCLVCPSLSTGNTRLPSSFQPGSICGAGIGTGGNKASEAGWGVRKSA